MVKIFIALFLGDKRYCLFMIRLKEILKHFPNDFIRSESLQKKQKKYGFFKKNNNYETESFTIILTISNF